MSLHAEPESAGNGESFGRRWGTPITASLVLVALTTLFLWAIEPTLSQDHLIFIYFVPTALISIRYGSTSAMCVTIASSLVASYFLYKPQFSFMVANRLDIMELVLFSLLAILASQVVSGFAEDRDVQRRKGRARTAMTSRRSGQFSRLLGRISSKFALR